MATDRTITMRIPADPPFLSVARMFGRSIASTFGLDPERSEDLRLALSEICAAAVVEGEPEGSVDLRMVGIDLTWDDAALRFSCTPAPGTSDDHRWMLLRALMPDIRVDEGTAAVSFSIER